MNLILPKARKYYRQIDVRMSSTPPRMTTTARKKMLQRKIIPDCSITNDCDPIILDGVLPYYVPLVLLSCIALIRCRSESIAVQVEHLLTQRKENVIPISPQTPRQSRDKLIFLTFLKGQILIAKVIVFPKQLYFKKRPIFR